MEIMVLLVPLIRPCIIQQSNVSHSSLFHIPSICEIYLAVDTSLMNIINESVTEGVSNCQLEVSPFNFPFYEQHHSANQRLGLVSA